MIIGKSNHPVYVKRISVRLWSLRDEIETALANRIQECEAAGIPVFIDDIKEFYRGSTVQNAKDNVEQLPVKTNEETNLESAPVDAGAPPAETTPPLEAAPADVPPAEPSAETPPPVEAAPVDGAAPASEAPKEIVENVAQAVMKEAGEQASKSQDQILKRPVERTIPNTEALSFGFSLLSDISMDGILIFSKNQFTYGQNVIIEFLIPHKFSVSAEVAYCQGLTNTSRIISASRPDYRIKLKFLFTIPGERQKLRSFLKSIEPDLTNLVKGAPKKAPAEGEDTDLSDLDF